MTAHPDSKWLSLLPTFIKNKIEGRHNLQKVLSNTSWLFFDRILRMGVGLIVGVWVARYLGPEQFGTYNFAAAFVALFGALVTLGLDGIVVRDIVRTPENKSEILSSAFILKFGGGCVAFLISLAAIYLMRSTDTQAHWLVGIIAAGMIFQSFDVIDLWFQSQMQSKFTVIAKNSAFVFLAMVRVVLILCKAPLTAFAWSALGEIIVGAAGLLLIYEKQQSFAVLCYPTIRMARNLIRESWPLILSSLVIMIYMRIDQIMLAQMVGNREVGLYSAALRISEIWYFIPVAIISSVMPSLTQSRSESIQKYYRQLQQLFNFLVKIAYLIALPMTFLSSFFVTSLYGPEYAGAGRILAIHIWSAVFVFIGVGMSPWTVNEGLMRYSLFQSMCGVVVNICLNIFLIPRYGGVGAAIATLISQMIASFLTNLSVSRLRIIFYMQLKALINPFHTIKT